MVLFSVCKYTKKCQDTQAFAMLFNPNWSIDRPMTDLGLRNNKTVWIKPSFLHDVIKADGGTKPLHEENTID